jgi:S1-C subfamily serine protease
MGTRGKLVEFCPKCGKRYVGDESKAGTRVKCPKLICGHTFVLPGHRTTGPSPRPRPKPKTSALKTVLVSLISLLTIGSIVLGTVLLIKKNKTTPPKPPGPIAKPPVKPPATPLEGEVAQKTLAQMVGMVVSGVKLSGLAGRSMEVTSCHGMLTLDEIKSAGVPREEVQAMCDLDDPYFHKDTKKVAGFDYGVGNTGSCFLITPDGFAITNQHVTEGVYYAQNHPAALRRLKTETFLAKPAWSGWSPQPQLWVFLDGEAHKATVVYQSAKFDCSILKIDGISGAPFFKLSAKKKADDLVVKTKVVTLGFPGSSRHRGSRSEKETELLKNKTKKKIKDWFPESDLKFVLKEGVVAVVKDRLDRGLIIEHDATINSGNSGGPLVSSAGLDNPTRDAVVYGINTWTLTVGDNSYLSIMMETVREEIDRYVPNAVWVDQ